jgi:hypothetical protein
MKCNDALVELLVDYIQVQWGKLEEGLHIDAKQSMIDFVDYCENLQITPGQNTAARDCLINIKRILENVLKVDMRLPANRKGDLPAALGLVSRKKDENQIRDQVIYLAYDHARYGTGVPGRVHDECDSAVSRALEEAKGIKLDTENVRKI